MSDSPAFFILANDRVLSNVFRLIASIKRLSFPNEIYIIPFNSELHYINKIKESFDLKFWEADYMTIDTLGRRIYDRDPPANPYPYMLGKLRKLAWLQYGGPSVFLDADCIVTSRPEIFNSVFSMDDNSIGYMNTSPDGVYEKNGDSIDLFKKSKFITSGIMAKSSATIPVSMLENFFSEAAIQKYLAVKRGGGYVDQPLWNFMIDTGLITSRDLLAGGQASRATNPESLLRINPDCTMTDPGGKPVLLLHIAGNLKQTDSFRFLRDAYVSAGLSQLQNAKPAFIGELFDFMEKQDGRR